MLYFNTGPIVTTTAGIEAMVCSIIGIVWPHNHIGGTTWLDLYIIASHFREEFGSIAWHAIDWFHRTERIILNCDRMMDYWR
jgi:hypothetical protein